MKARRANPILCLTAGKQAGEEPAGNAPLDIGRSGSLPRLPLGLVVCTGRKRPRYRPAQFNHDEIRCVMLNGAESQAAFENLFPAGYAIKIDTRTPSAVAAGISQSEWSEINA